MKNSKKTIIPAIFVILFAHSLFAQYNGHKLGFSLNYNYTTTSRIYPFPKSVDPIQRESYSELEDINSYSGELRYKISDVFALGLGVEFMNKTKSSTIVVGGQSGSLRAKIEEGFSVVPIELTGYYLLPFTSLNLRFYMGGGIGAYIGDKIRNISNVGLKTVKREISYGILVNMGLDYLFYENFSVRGEMRFRDPQMTIKSKYSNNTVVIQGRTYSLSPGSFDSKINVNGITFSLGIVVHLF